MTTELTIPTSIQQPDQNPAVVYIAQLASEHSRRNMLRHLDKIAELATHGEQNAYQFQWGALRYAHTAAIRARLLESGVYSTNTVNTMLAALRGVLKEAWQLNQMSSEDYYRTANIKNIKASVIPAGRDIAPAEISALVEICQDGTKAGARDTAMIALLYACGLRRSEVVALDVADFDSGNGQLKIIAAKGRKDRIVYAQGGALDALLDWLHVRGWQAGPLFVPVRKGDKPAIQRLTPQSVYDILHNRAAGAKMSPHDFRRTFVGDMLDRGVDIATVANIAGHASVDTTRRYDRRPEETKRQAAAKLHFPYKRQD